MGKRRKEPESEDDEETTAAAARKLKEARELQGMRSRTSGMASEELAIQEDPDAQKKKKKKKKEGEGEGGEEEEEDDDRERGLAATFTSSEVSEKTQIEKTMSAWVDKQLEDGKEEEAEEKVYVDPRNALYDTGDNEAFQAAVAANKERTSEEATWLTGITEVQLPMEFKVKNIEATEAAKLNLMAARKAKSGPDDASFAPKSITADYKTHRREHYHNVIKPNQRGRGGPRGPGMASDDMAVARYRKRARDRRW